jgi:hypothetical protein
MISVRMTANRCNNAAIQILDDDYRETNFTFHIFAPINQGNRYSVKGMLGHSSRRARVLTTLVMRESHDISFG